MDSRIKKLLRFKSEMEGVGVKVHQMSHAFRYNDVVDVYKDRNTVFYLPKNHYERFETFDECLTFAKALLNDNYTKLYLEEKKEERRLGKIAYKEFKRSQEDNYKISTFQEDYYMRLDGDCECKKCDDDLYFLWVKNRVKIGRTKNINNRLKQLKTGLADHYIVYVFKGKGYKEKHLQNLFTQHKTHLEWFDGHEQIARFCHVHFRKGIDICINPQWLKFPYYNPYRFK